MKLAIISGGSRGLGQALCEQHQQSGYDVVEFSRTAPHSYSVACDFADPQAAAGIVTNKLNTLVQQAWSELVVIHNAGILTPIGAVQDKKLDEVVANLHIGVVSAVLLMSAALRAFQHHTCAKTLLNISSGAALKGRAGWSLYCASKAAGENFIRSVALEQALRPYPFRVLNVDPGVIDTAMQAEIRASSPADFPDVESFVERKEKGLLRDPAQVARAIMRIECLQLESGSRVSVNDFFD